MKNLLVRASICLLAFIGVNLSTAAQIDNKWDQGPKLYCGTDATSFAGENGQLAVVRTSGASIVGKVEVFNLDAPLNGITFENFSLWAGQPEDVNGVAGNTLRKVSVSNPPEVLNTIEPGSSSFSANCCSEQMTLFKGKLYHAHYSDSIQQLAIDTFGDSEVAVTYPQSDVVGMASDSTQIWISKWSEKQVWLFALRQHQRDHRWVGVCLCRTTSSQQITLREPGAASLAQTRRPFVRRRISRAGAPAPHVISVAGRCANTASVTSIRRDIFSLRLRWKLNR